MERLSQRLLPLFLIFFTTCCSVATIALRDKRGIGDLNHWISRNKSNLALAIQLIASSLGSCQIFALSCLLNFHSRLRFQKSGTSLQSLSFWIHISNGVMWWSLPFHLLLPLAVMLVLCLAPQALWAGALTPLFVPYNSTIGTIPIPAYRTTSADIWQGLWTEYPDGSAQGDYLHCLTNTSSSFVSSCPVLDQSGGPIQSINTASRIRLDSETFARTRIDNSGWHTLGRSYGVGSSPGVIDGDGAEFDSDLLNSFTYSETGYETQVSCLRNETCNYTITTTYTASVDGSTDSVHMLKIGGTLPNSPPGTTLSDTSS